MFGWLKKRVLNASADAMKNDIERFTAGLEGADAEEISTMLVIENILRLRMLDSGVIPAAALDLSIPRDEDVMYQCDMCSLKLVNGVKKFQKIGQPSDAAGAMIWLHSVRALNVPEIRVCGRKMWGQLVRGFPYVDNTLGTMRAVMGTRLHENIDEELRFIPIGLEPIETGAN
ncbi:hypothetical protein GS627_17795 [Ruegeria sp. HKCCD7318]|nr:hypothetical protein [Ruegeria sp. HKCCD7318]